MSTAEKTERPGKTEREPAIMVLFYCLGTRPEAIRSEKIEHLSMLEWEAVLQLAIRHGVAPLLYYHLKSHIPGTTIPENILRQLHKFYLLSAAANIRLYHELSQVLRILDKNNIPVIVLKGAHLAEQVYKNIALRPMGDIDLMIEKKDLPHVGRPLLDAGYTPLKPFCFEAEEEISRHLPLFRKEGEPGIEIHWTLSESSRPFHIDIEGCWERAHTSIIVGHDVLTLAPEDLLLYLSLHIASSMAMLWLNGYKSKKSLPTKHTKDTKRKKNVWKNASNVLAL